MLQSLHKIKLLQAQSLVQNRDIAYAAMPKLTLQKYQRVYFSQHQKQQPKVLTNNAVAGANRKNRDNDDEERGSRFNNSKKDFKKSGIKDGFGSRGNAF